MIVKSRTMGMNLMQWRFTLGDISRQPFDSFGGKSPILDLNDEEGRRCRPQKEKYEVKYGRTF
jgi:hypothetical protein